MSIAPPIPDLVAQAARRARLAALLGQLLLEEPGPALAELTAGVGVLEPLATGDPALAVAYERLLLREVPPYESVFTDHDGQLGGEVAGAVSRLYERHGFDEAGRWRVAGPDHAGLELRLYARLCAQEAAAWQDDRPDQAVAAVEAERLLLAEHLGRWGPVFADVLAERAGSGPYAALARALGEFLAEEADRLRPAPDHPEMPAVEARVPPARPGPARLARWLLAPGSAGAWLGGDTLGAAALGLGIPWRPSDPRSHFRQVVEEATDSGDLAELLAGLRPAVAAWRDRHAGRVESQPGLARVWRSWQLQAEQTLALIDRTAQAHAGPAGAPVVVTVTGAQAAADAARAVLALGLRAAVAVEIPPPVATGITALVTAGVDDVVLVDRSGRSVGSVGEAAAADVVIRVEPGATGVSVEGDGPREQQVRQALAGIAR